MRPGDLAAVLEIERACFPDPWPRSAFLHEIRDNPFAGNFVLREREPPGRLKAYACVWFLGDELHINNIAVHPGARRAGLGRRLMEHILDEGRRRGCLEALLQVRPSNEAALALYRVLGFSVVGRRPRYYSRSGEDAIVMSLPLGAK